MDKNGFLSRNRDSLDRSLDLTLSARKRRKSDYNFVDDSGYAEEDSVAGMSALSFKDEKAEDIVSPVELCASMVCPILMQNYYPHGG